MTADPYSQAVEIARAQAAAYVWGRQDAGESNRDTGYSLDFGNAYAERKRAYLEGSTGYLPNLETAYLDWKQEQTEAAEAAGRLEYLRSQIRKEQISYGELAELQSLAAHIDRGDTELLEAAGVPEFPEEQPAAGPEQTEEQEA